MKYFWWILLALVISLAILSSCSVFNVKYKIGTRVRISPMSETEEHSFNRCEDYGIVMDFDRTEDGIFYTVKFPCLDQDNRRVFRDIEYQQSLLTEIKEGT